MLFSIFTNESLLCIPPIITIWSPLSPSPLNSLVTDDDGGPSPLHTKGGGGGDAAAPETGPLSWPGTVESESKVTLLRFTCVLVVLNCCMNEVVALDTDVDSMHAHMRLTGG